MRKNIVLFLTLILALCVGFFTLTACGGDGGDLKFYLLDDGTYGVRIGQMTKAKEIEIPEIYKGKNVTQILDGFVGGENEYLENIIIPNSITTIGEQAFYGCSSLTSVTIGDGVKKIGNFAFYDCSSLTSVTIGDGVKKMGEYAFYGCPIENATIPAIACEFINNSKLKTVAITSGTSIASSAFSYCKSLTSVTIADSVTDIGSIAFYGCNSSMKVNYLGSIDSWCEINFDGYKANPIYFTGKLYINDELVTIANITKTTKINEYAFYNCKSLTSLTVGDSVTSIGGGAFENCNLLASVIIGNNVENIGRFAFGGCESLTNLTFRDTTTWYRTTSETSWQNMTGGTIIDMANPSTNATKIRSPYWTDFLYKL